MKKRLALASALAALILLSNGAYIYAKARYGQFLLERAWARTRRGEANAKPWSWADTSPIARLEFPARHASYIVLNGASGRTMAWGPGHVDGTAMPNAPGNCAISAHRDTQFSVLRDVAVGDEIVVQSADGASLTYRVVEARVTTDRDLALLAPSSGRVLTLITCYPFDALTPGGHGRYAVIAQAASFSHKIHRNDG